MFGAAGRPCCRCLYCPYVVDGEVVPFGTHLPCVKVSTDWLKCVEPCSVDDVVDDDVVVVVDVVI